MQCDVLIKISLFSQFWRQSVGSTCIQFDNLKMKQTRKHILLNSYYAFEAGPLQYRVLELSHFVGSAEGRDKSGGRP